MECNGCCALCNLCFINTGETVKLCAAEQRLGGENRSNTYGAWSQVVCMNYLPMITRPFIKHRVYRRQRKHATREGVQDNARPRPVGAPGHTQVGTMSLGGHPGDRYSTQESGSHQLGYCAGYCVVFRMWGCSKPNALECLHALSKSRPNVQQTTCPEVLACTE